jgi:hypothetical protein
MATAVALLFALGCLGATDIVLFHSFSHGIRRHVDSRAELWIHALRGPLYASLFLALPNFTLAGGWIVALYALLLIDVLITVVDFAVEGASREKLGGLPSGEYVLHMLIGMTFGAFAATAVAATWSNLISPSALNYARCVGPLAQIVFALMAALVFYSGVLDARAAWKLEGASLAIRLADQVAR